MIVLCPNHTGLDNDVSIIVEDAWRTPLGDVKINVDLTRKTHKSSGLIDVIETRHMFEHSIEVQLPFLQYIVKSKNISMCGYGPVSAAIITSKNLDATNSLPLSYKTSGDMTGD